MEPDNKPRAPRATPGALETMILYFLVAVIYILSLARFYPQFGFMPTVFAGELVLFMAVPVFYAWFLGYDLKEVFSLRRPKLRDIVITALITLSAYALIMFLFSQKLASGLFTVEELKLLRENDEVAKTVFESGWIVLPMLVLVLLPAFAEETLFRGFMLSGLSKTFGQGAAIFVSGLMFGMLHGAQTDFMSLFGVLLAFVVVRGRSIFLGIFGHFLFNFTSVMIYFFVDSSAESLDPGQEPLPIAIGIAGTVGIIVGVLAMWRSWKAVDGRLKAQG